MAVVIPFGTSSAGARTERTVPGRVGSGRVGSGRGQ